MQETTITRQQIIQALSQHFEPLPQVYALWEGGAAAFGRVDAWSDIDIQIDVADDFAESAMQQAEQVLNQVSPVEIKYEIPQPTWHGHLQAFFRLERTSPYLLIDLVIIKHSIANKFLEKEIHGETVVHFDKVGVTKAQPLDREQFARILETRIASLRTMADLFSVLTLKELNRGNVLEALAFYQSYSLRTLVEALHILHAPAHYNFYTRYIHYDLPDDVVKRLEELYFVSGVEDIRRKRSEAEMWLERTLAEIELTGLQELVETHLGTKA